MKMTKILSVFLAIIQANAGLETCIAREYNLREVNQSSLKYKKPDSKAEESEDEFKMVQKNFINFSNFASYFANFCNSEFCPFRKFSRKNQPIFFDDIVLQKMM